MSINGNDPAFNGFIKTNNIFAYNAYVWPPADGASNQRLTTDGAGNLSWAAGSSMPTGPVIPPLDTTNEIFYENQQTVLGNYTVPTSVNAMSAGPITIASGVTVTISAGSSWAIV